MGGGGGGRARHDFLCKGIKTQVKILFKSKVINHAWKVARSLDSVCSIVGKITGGKHSLSGIYITYPLQVRFFCLNFGNDMQPICWAPRYFFKKGLLLGPRWIDALYEYSHCPYFSVSPVCLSRFSRLYTVSSVSLMTVRLGYNQSHCRRLTSVLRTC